MKKCVCVFRLSCDRGERGDHMQLLEGPNGGRGGVLMRSQCGRTGCERSGQGIPRGVGMIEGWPMGALCLCAVFFGPMAGRPLGNLLGGSQGFPELGEHRAPWAPDSSI